MTKSLGQAYVKISFSLHHSKKADSHSEDKASYTNGNARTALLNCLPVIICSTDPAAYYPNIRPTTIYNRETG
jgi:hypothetical protein